MTCSRRPGQLHCQLDNDEFRLYELIWQRTVASQMADARGTTLTLRITGTARHRRGVRVLRVGPHHHLRRASSRPTSRASTSRPAASPTTPSPGCPSWNEGQGVTATELTADGHTTNPPARYTEASLIKTLEELGIGRPSTYSSIIKTIQDRGYVYKRGSALVPSWVAFAVIGLLEPHFGRLVDFDFTAAWKTTSTRSPVAASSAETGCPASTSAASHGAEGSVARSGGLKKMVGVNLDDIDAREVNSIKLFDDDEGRDVVRPRRPVRSVSGADDHQSR